MPYLKFWKYDNQGRFEQVIESYSDTDVAYEDVKTPKNTTTVQPPEYDTETEVPVWDGEQWGIRSLEYFNRPSSLHEWDEETQTWVIENLERYKGQKKRELARRFQDKLSEGFMTSNGIMLNARPEDYQFYLTGKVRAQKKLQDGIEEPVISYMKDHFGECHQDIPASDYIMMVEELEEHFEALWNTKVEKEIAVEQAETVDDIDAVEWE